MRIGIQLGMWMLTGALGLGQAADTAPGTGTATASTQSTSGTAQVKPAAAPAPEKKEQALKRRQARAARHAAIDSLRQAAMAKAQAAHEARKAAEKASSSQMVNEQLKKEAAAKAE